MNTDYGLAEILAAIERSKVSGVVECTPDIEAKPNYIRDLLDRHMPGQYDHQDMEGGYGVNIWMSHDDGSHWWEVNIPLTNE